MGRLGRTVPSLATNPAPSPHKPYPSLDRGTVAGQIAPDHAVLMDKPKPSHVTAWTATNTTTTAIKKG
jgi:hypothetical protein